MPVRHPPTGPSPSPAPGSDPARQRFCIPPGRRKRRLRIRRRAVRTSIRRRRRARCTGRRRHNWQPSAGPRRSLRGTRVARAPTAPRHVPTLPPIDGGQVRRRGLHPAVEHVCRQRDARSGDLGDDGASKLSRDVLAPGCGQHMLDQTGCGVASDPQLMRGGPPAQVESVDRARWGRRCGCHVTSPSDPTCFAVHGKVPHITN